MKDHDSKSICMMAAPEDSDRLSGSGDVYATEIHHRVKNNFQVLSSLLNIHMHRATDAELKHSLADCIGRIQSFARMHELLCSTGGSSMIPLDVYLGRLCSLFREGYGIESDRVGFEVHVEKIYVDSALAVDVGLIISEALSNAVKHGIGYGREMDGTSICIRCGRDGDDLLAVVWNDGQPADTKAFEESTSYGRVIMCELVGKYDGSVELTTDNGTSFKVRIPLS